MGGIDRRALLRRVALVAAGAGAGAFAFAELAVGTNGGTPSGHWQQPTVIRQVRTGDNLIALTFDDGPRPKWTPMVLDTLDRYRVPATFFLVGKRVREHGDILSGRLGRHEVGNHTWAHLDLRQRNADQAYADLHRTHEAIVDVTGRTPTLMRPPYGHFGESAALAVNRLGYRVILWSLELTRPRSIVERSEPGSIVLAHDVGGQDRLVALRGLPDLIVGLRARGFRFVTVSDLLAGASTLA